MTTPLTPLPIDDALPELLAALRDRRAAVLVAPPGAGKTTRVPLAIRAARMTSGQIWVLQPRRVAARAVAQRMADELGERLGEHVGYQVRFERVASQTTKILVVTEGILTRRLQSDPTLDGISCVILDELHERSIHTDLALAMLREVRQIRDDLLIVAMSATLDADPVAAFLNAPIIRAPGRAYPLDIAHLTDPYDQDSPADIARVVSKAVRELVDGPRDDRGDLLVFLPGAAEIHACISALEGFARAKRMTLAPLYGALPFEQQVAALTPSTSRRAIFATNIAQTSLTVPHITAVIDTGLVKRMEWSPQTGIDQLVLRRVSRASADQRAGRAGRTRPGRVLRLWSHIEDQHLDQDDTPELRRLDVCGPVLDVIAWSGADPARFGWFEAPSAHALARAVALLRQLRALAPNSWQLTDLGKRLQATPLAPRLAALLAEGAWQHVREQAAQAAALLSEGDFIRDVRPGSPGGECDLWRRVEVLGQVAKGETKYAEMLGMNAQPEQARRIIEVSRQLMQVSADWHAMPAEQLVGSPEQRMCRAVMAAWPDRVGFARGGQDYVVVGAGTATLAQGSIVRNADTIIAPVISGARHVEGALGVQQRPLIRIASRIERGWLAQRFPERIVEHIELGWDHEKKRVMAHKRRRFDGVILDEQVASVTRDADMFEVAKILGRAASADLTAAFGLDTAGEQVLLRLCSLSKWRPELELPYLPPTPPPEGRDEAAEALIASLCVGARSFADLAKLDITEQLRGALTRDQWRALEQDAPPRLTVPSGSSIRLDYQADGTAPVLAVRIQEIFGLDASPTVAGGKIAVLLHLLSPGYKPVQVTQDLKSFWATTYAEVRRELRARYPKHAWPDDPTRAEPVKKGRSER
jgi:ATP-dependent helicase HrpB